MTDETQVVTTDEGEFSLADIANIDMSEIEAYRFTQLQPGKYHFRVEETELGTVEVSEDYDDPNSAKVMRPAAVFKLVVQNCLALVDDKADPASFVGQHHTVAFKIKEIKKDLGKAKAFMEDIRFEGTGNIQELMDAIHGHEFVSDIKHGVNRFNPEFPYINFKNGQTTEEFNESQANAAE